MNDPNGLVKYKDTWFLFYQLNPSDTVPGNTHWGMAVSRDLLHWQHCPPAICPDDADGNIFSGSGIVDSRMILNSTLNRRPRFGQRPVSKAAEVCIALQPHPGSRFAFSLFGVPVSYNHDLRTLLFPTGEFPLPAGIERLELRMIADRGGIELFARGGMFNAALNMYLDPTKPPLDFLSLEHSTVSAAMYELAL